MFNILLKIHCLFCINFLSALTYLRTGDFLSRRVELEKKQKAIGTLPIDLVWILYLG